MKRFSRKREAILEAIRSTTSHPSAEWIYLKLKPEYPDLSLSTVYRNITEFIERGEIISVGNVSGQERYDGCPTPHAHLICDTCSSIIDIPRLETLMDVRSVENSTGSVISNYAITFRGKCKKCLEASNGAK